MSRLRDSQLGDEHVADIAHYIKRGVLWEAFESEAPAVVLIDEIDKADIEFPNDLLRELDRMEFYVYETQRTVGARHRPLVVITSNNEKELPDAFLRRCFFHYIRFPDRETMTRIVDVHFPGLKKALLAEALEVFFGLREVPGLKKKPSTSELLDWLKLLLAEDIPPEALKSTDRKVVIPPLHGALSRTSRTSTSSSASRSWPARGGRSMAFAEPVTLEGEHVRLEPMTHARADAIAAELGRAAADGAMWESKVTTIPRPEGAGAYVAQAIKELDAGVSLPFVTIDRASGKAIGSTRYMNIEAPHRRLEIGTTWIGKSFQRTAINTEAKYLMLRHAFEVLHCIAVDLGRTRRTRSRARRSSASARSSTDPAEPPDHAGRKPPQHRELLDRR